MMVEEAEHGHILKHPGLKNWNLKLQKCNGVFGIALDFRLAKENKVVIPADLRKRARGAYKRNYTAARNYYTRVEQNYRKPKPLHSIHFNF